MNIIIILEFGIIFKIKVILIHNGIIGANTRSGEQER